MVLTPRTVLLKGGQQIILRSAEGADSENLLKHLFISHSESYRNLNQSANHWSRMSVEAEEKILNDFEESPSKFMMIALIEDEIIGGLGFFGYQSEFTKTTASFGMSIQQAFSNSGLGSHMITFMLHAAKEFGFHRIEMTVRTYNLPGIKLYEKFGFTRIGLLKDAALIDGEFVDEYSYQKIIT